MMKRLLCMLLVLALLVGCMPMAAAAKEDEDFSVYQAAVDTTIRKEPYQDAGALSKIRSDTLLYCTGSLKNKYGNIWLEVMDPASGTTGYVYSGKVVPHECSYTLVNGSENLGFCRCGNVMEVEQKKGTTQISADAAALPNPMIDPEVLATLGLAARGMLEGAAGAVAAAAPYLAVGLIAGSYVYLVFTVAGSAVDVKEVSIDWERLDKDFKPEKGDYYKAMIHTDGYMYIGVNKPMDMNNAVSCLDLYINTNQLSYKAIKSYWFIYTYDRKDAEDLVKTYISKRKAYTCINLTNPDVHGSVCDMKQYKHFHIVPALNHNDHLGGHICFGAPQQDTFREGDWA